jgi:hypothetical protein
MLSSAPASAERRTVINRGRTGAVIVAEERRQNDSDRRATPRGGRRQLDVIRYLEDNDVGQPLSTDQLARAIGVSTTTIRADIRYGALKAFKAGGRPGTRKEWRVLFAEAKRYLVQMGVLSKPPVKRTN